jgi:hypothetical protein
MTDLSEADLVQLARQYYSAGFPVSTDDHSQDLLAYQRSPEHERWRAAWGRAMAWKEWDVLLSELETAFPNLVSADCTQPWMTACRRCCVYLERPLPDGAKFIMRVAAAASILAPLYVTYCTTATVKGGIQKDLRFSFEPTTETREHTATLANLVERILGYRPFPLRFTDTLMPEVRVGHIRGKEATLLDAFFDNHLENLF